MTAPATHGRVRRMHEIAGYVRMPLAGVLVAGLLVAAAAPGQPIGTAKDATFTGLISSTVFKTVNRDDARAALKVCFDLVGRRNGYQLDSTIDIVDSVAEIRDRLRSHSVSLITLSVFEYLELENSHLMTPVLTDVRSSQGAAPYSYVLLANSARGISTVAELRGKNLLMYSRGSGRAAPIWLEMLLNREKLGFPASFFGSIKTIEKPQACILPLFFGAADACLVDDVNLDLAREMNPQLARLSVLARSRPMIEAVIAVPSEPRPFQSELIEAMLDLTADPRGRQLLMVFKTDRLVRLDPRDLDSARELWNDYHRLAGAPGRPAPSREQERREP